MSRNLDQAREQAYHLSRSLMIAVVLFETDQDYGVMTADDYDGEDSAIVQEYNPWDASLRRTAQ